MRRPRVVIEGLAPVPAPDTVLVHVVLIKFKTEASDDVRQKIYDMYQTLGEDCGGRDAGILYWAVKQNLDQRKGWNLVELAFFTDDKALQTFRVHPAHTAVTNILRDVADWVVGDFLGPPPIF